MLVGDAEIESRGRVGLIAGERAFVTDNRSSGVTRFEREVSQIHVRRGVRRVEFERRVKIAARLRVAAKRDPRDAALIEQEGVLGSVEPRRRRQGLEQLLGLGKAARAQEPQGALARFFGRTESEKAPQREHRRCMFTIDVVSLFPEVFAPFVGLSIIGRAVEAGIVDVRYHHLLDALLGAERADDDPYGGGAGMVMRIEPVARVLDAILAHAPAGERRVIAVPSPAGKRFEQSDARRFAGLDRLVLICGHYEGIDERLTELYPVEEYSLGDFVLTGGELPALAFMDATVRLLEGAIAPESAEAESFSEGLLDYPSYTRPPVFRGVAVPEVLLSGNHAKIAEWRRAQSRARTAARRKDLLGGG